MTQQDNGGSETAMDYYVYPGDRFTQSGMKSGHGTGMTLRDWFAGRALALIKTDNVNGNANSIAIAAYTLADAMLAARSAK